MSHDRNWKKLQKQVDEDAQRVVEGRDDRTREERLLDIEELQFDHAYDTLAPLPRPARGSYE